MASSSWAVLQAQALCLLNTVVALVFVAPQIQPTPYAALVKLLPCLSLLLYVWTAQTSNQPDKTAQTSRGTLLDLLAFSDKLAGNSVEGKNKNVSKGRTSGSRIFVHQRQLTAGMARGLLFSMVGDVFLVWHEQEAPFMMGMLAFAFAQLCYIHGLGFGRMRIVSGVFTYGLVACFTAVVLVDAPRLFQVLVPCYAALLATTLWRALDRCGVEDGRPLWQRRSMVLGALVFVLSDTFIALFKFVVQARSAVAQSIILSTYFLAQNLLIFGAVGKP